MLRFLSIIALVQLCTAQRIPEVAQSAGFRTLVKFVGDAGLVDALNGDGPFTVFAPTDAAFAKLPESIVRELTNNKDLLSKVLLYHVVEGRFPSNSLSNDISVDTLAKRPLRINICDRKVTVNGKRVTQPDVQADNGIIHVIDEVIYPFAEKDVAGVVTDESDLSTLLTAVSQAGLVGALQGQGPITVFAPTNAAFNKIPKSQLDALLQDKRQLTQVLKRHVISGAVFAQCLNANPLTSLNNNESIRGRVRARRSALCKRSAEPGCGGHGGRRQFGNGQSSFNQRAGRAASRVVQADLVATNGVVHKIDMVLL